MTDPGLRERKKQQTRLRIADAAARLFGRHGYENVAMADVATAADVSLQTVYNYFGAKRDLLLDREDEITESMVSAVTQRPPRTSPVAALRPAVLAEVDLLRRRTKKQAAGDLPALCASSAEVRRYALEARDRQADAVADAIVASTRRVDRFSAKAQAVAVLSVVQSLLDHVGRRIVEGASPSAVADEAEPLVRAALDDLERRFASGRANAFGP